MKLYCTKCDEPVSTEVPDGTIIGGMILCPSCIQEDRDRVLSLSTCNSDLAKEIQKLIQSLGAIEKNLSVLRMEDNRAKTYFNMAYDTVEKGVSTPTAALTWFGTEMGYIKEGKE